MIAIRGANSRIAQELVAMLPEGEAAIAVPRGAAMPIEAERYFFCQGLLYPKRESEQTEDEIAESLAVNHTQIVCCCEQILEANSSARICVMGSESGFSGSYDGTYAAAKTKLHAYVESRCLRSPRQQLVCVAPSIVDDAGMTLRREDKDNLENRRMSHPKRRYLKSMEVARLVHFLLYVDRGYISNTVVRVHGGSAAWA